MREDQVEAAWKILMPVLEAWDKMTPGDFPNYKAGSCGPEEIQKLLVHKDHCWLLPNPIS